MKYKTLKQLRNFTIIIFLSIVSSELSFAIFQKLVKAF